MSVLERLTSRNVGRGVLLFNICVVQYPLGQSVNDLIQAIFSNAEPIGFVDSTMRSGQKFRVLSSSTVSYSALDWLLHLERLYSLSHCKNSTIILKRISIAGWFALQISVIIIFSHFQLRFRGVNAIRNLVEVALTMFSRLRVSDNIFFLI